MTIRFWTPKKVFLSAFLIILAIYIPFQARNFILGPRLTIQSPGNGESLTGNTIKVTGTARNVSFITLNDRQIFVNDEGNFSETLLSPVGLAILTLKGKDRFGRESQVERQFFSLPEKSDIIKNTSATSTATTTQI